VPRKPSFLLKINIKQPYSTSLSLSLSPSPVRERNKEKESEKEGERELHAHASRKYGRAVSIPHSFSQSECVIIILMMRTSYCTNFAENLLNRLFCPD
jgi:hypothetical protein